MNIVTDIEEWQTIRQSLKSQSIGFVPTMGHLHEGHMSLCDRAKRENALTVVSIFVNPTQFDQSCDFDHYPRTIETDVQVLQSHYVDYVLLPDANAMYPDHYEVQVIENALSLELEGAFRLGHFHGMLTIVLKFLNLVSPTRAYFGEKDYQQLLLIQKMVKALFLPVEIIPCATVRAQDGLAQSSRNSRLTQEERKKAAQFPMLMQCCTHKEDAIAQLSALGFKVDYIVDQWQRRLGAVWLSDVRLIDNILI